MQEGPPTRRPTPQIALKLLLLLKGRAQSWKRFSWGPPWAQCSLGDRRKKVSFYWWIFKKIKTNILICVIIDSTIFHRRVDLKEEEVGEENNNDDAQLIYREIIFLFKRIWEYFIRFTNLPTFISLICFTMFTGPRTHVSRRPCTRVHVYTHVHIVWKS